ncbi:DinB family protein [Neobacillus sp. Marseille-QA0830]
MKKKEELINEFSKLISFVESLRELDEEKWTTPIEEGKWATRDVVAHIMLWDQYFLEEAIKKITSHQSLTVKHLDYDEFNKKAIEFAKEKSKRDIIDMSIYFRKELIHHLGSISNEDFTKAYIDGDGNHFSADNYLMSFISHDFYHINQLKLFFSKV